jgi:uncharacterized protein (DUF885 family)
MKSAPALSRRNLLMASAAAALVGACKQDRSALPGPTGSMASDRALAREFSAMAEALLKEFPENATFRGVDKDARAALKHQLSDRSEAGRAARTTAARSRLTALQAIDRGRLTPGDLTAYDSAVYAHQLAIDGAGFGYGDVNPLSAIQSYVTTPYAVTQLSGNFTQVPDFLNSVQTTETAADAEAWLDRLRVYASGMDQETERLASDAAKGVIAPVFVLDNIIGQLEGALKAPVGDWVIVKALSDKMKARGVAGDWSGRAAALATGLVGPAMQRQLDGLKALKPRATTDAGVWKLPRGEEFYAWCLKVGTTTDQTPDEIHRVGLSEVRRIEARMDELLRAQGLTQGTAGARADALAKDPRFLFPNTDQGRADLIAYLNGRIAAVRARMPELFRTLPKADLVIKRVPPEIEAGAPGGYEVDGSLDGMRPANYYINLRDTSNWPKFLLPTLCFHEGIPGHVWQGAFAAKMPLIRSLIQFNAYTEGWALYCEQMAQEIGLYRDDPFGEIGYLSDQMLRACRLVVDTGLHAMRWTREQSTQFMHRYTGQPLDGVQGETDRYCAMPGQACGYMTGRLEILRQRERARAGRGAKFDIRDFNDAMVTCGSVPLAVLTEVTDRYVKS